MDPRAFDALIALILTAVALGTVAGRIDENAGFRDDDLLGVALLLGQTLPLAARRVAPLGVLIAIGSAIAAHAALGYQMVEAGTFSSLVALYGVASLTDSWRGTLGAVATGIVMAVFFSTNRQEFGPADVATTAVTWAAAWVLGTYVRIRGEQAQAAEERADQLDRDRELRAREAVADERARIARELHDIVGHALNVIVIQAGGAQRVFESRPDRVRDSLASIESVGRQALADMQRMVEILRASDGDDKTLSPQPTLGQLGILAEQVSQAGLPVEVAIDGKSRELPPSVDLSAYRIIQEALTNSLKHAGATSAKVAIRYGDNDLELEITDNGRGVTSGSQSDHRGRGLIGMRERVALFDGEVSLGPRPEGGFRVHARLPLGTS
jgi:signal transduction histidine kinase